jgi:two-component system nitrogen regulation sensor histidine kinase NtrY
MFLWVGNWLLIVVLVVLILRNLIKLFLERRGGVLGSRFKTKLVLAFTALCLLPSLFLMTAAVKVIEWSVDRWFSLEAEEMTEQAMSTWKELKGVWAADTAGFAEAVATDLPSRTLLSRARLERHLEQERQRRRLDVLTVYLADGRAPVELRGEGIPTGDPESGTDAFIQKVMTGERGTYLEQVRSGFLVWAGEPLAPGTDGMPAGAVIVGRFLPRSVMDQAERLVDAAVGYRQASVRKPEIKTIFILLFVLLTLMTVFAAVWIGLTVSRSITEPVEALTAGTREVQDGNLDVEVDVRARDELGNLVTSFNEMVTQLKLHKEQVEEASSELKEASEESERRRRYIETLLQNLTTGVLSLDEKGRVTLANRAAYKTLRLPEKADAVGLQYGEMLALPGHAPLREALSRYMGHGEVSLSREMVLDLGSQRVNVAASFAALRDREGEFSGMLVVIDDVTNLVNAQRVAAWREVARRMAHEIKNPLTPIQLSVQRIVKAYGESGRDFPRILDDGAKTVIAEVEALRKFVDEFSRFARLPASNPVPSDLREVVRASVKLYEGHEGVQIETDLDDLPDIPLDAEAMRRVMGNLLDNAIEVMQDRGRIVVSTRYQPDRQAVLLVVADEGPGIPNAMRDRLFVPYFSTKENGSGLGLAIVNRIVLDHNGRIRVEDNQPQGSRFVIELPA